MANDIIIRLSPSGPRINNGQGPGGDGEPGVTPDGGAPFAPGPGMQLRLVEAKATIGGAITQTLDELGTEALRVVLDNPNPLYHYKAYCQINSAYFVAMLMVIQRSVDGGTTWEDVSVDSFVGNTSVYRMAVANAKMDLGNDEFGWDIPPGAPSLMIRCMVGTGTNTYVGQIETADGFIGLAELF